jgi:hypothetical protein
LLRPGFQQQQQRLLADCLFKQQRNRSVLLRPGFQQQQRLLLAG